MAINAGYVIRRVQELAQVFGSASQFWSGFPGDTAPDDSSTPLLPLLNEYLFELSGSGYLRKYFSITAITDQSRYTVPVECRDIISVYWNGKALRRASREHLDSRVRDWRTESGTPLRYIPEGQTITLYPAPHGVAPCQVFGVGTPALLTANTSILEGMSDAQAIRAAYGPALTAAIIDDTNTSHVQRIQRYQAVADKLFAELVAQQTKQDDYGSASLDSFVLQPTTSTATDTGGT